jgi:hypothetical protein
MMTTNSMTRGREKMKVWIGEEERVCMGVVSVLMNKKTKLLVYTYIISQFATCSLFRYRLFL